MKKIISILLALMMVLTLAACGGSGDALTVPAINHIDLGTDYQDIKADIRILTNRTDIVDTVYKGYADQFHALYPNITVTYEGITDYEESLRLRLTTGDWGDICFIPTSVQKSQLGDYFIPLGSFDEMDPLYNFMSDKSYDGVVYGIANGGTADGVVYNRRVWQEAGITEVPSTPEEFLQDLQIIKDNTDAIPLYTNFAAGWTMGAWDAYIWVAATGDPDFHSNIVHMANPFSDRGDQTGPYAVYYASMSIIHLYPVPQLTLSMNFESFAYLRQASFPGQVRFHRRLFRFRAIYPVPLPGHERLDSLRLVLPHPISYCPFVHPALSTGLRLAYLSCKA